MFLNKDRGKEFAGAMRKIGRHVTKNLREVVQHMEEKLMSYVE